MHICDPEAILIVPVVPNGTSTEMYFSPNWLPRTAILGDFGITFDLSALFQLSFLQFQSTLLEDYSHAFYSKNGHKMTELHLENQYSNI